MTHAHETGTIKLYFPAKGYGFITPDKGGADVMFFGDALLDKNAVPERDMRVAYRLYTHETKGLRAADVRIHAPGGKCPLCGAEKAR